MLVIKGKWHKSIKAGRYTSGRNRRYGCNYGIEYRKQVDEGMRKENVIG